MKSLTNSLYGTKSLSLCVPFVTIQVADSRLIFPCNSASELINIKLNMSHTGIKFPSLTNKQIPIRSAKNYLLLLKTLLANALLLSGKSLGLLVTCNSASTLLE